MRIEFIPKHHAKILAIEPLSEKRGQTDLLPAVAVTLRLALPTERLNILDASLRDFLFVAAEKKQGELEPTLTLTDAAKAIGAFGWDGEQTGTKLNVYFGISGDMNFKLTDGVISKVKVVPRDGGWDLELRYYSAKDIDEEVIGGLGVLKNHDVDIEIVPPESIDKQPDLVDQSQQETPEKALAKAVKGGKGGPRQTPKQALAAHLGLQEH
jgi:hypothetical protein